ncbi:unnamed protein product [Heterobilharzia americana]|nr:unnamed protein product [Heterobilharzia americana]
MGIYGLWGILSSVQEYRPLAEIGCNSVAVDLSIWICEDKSVGPSPTLHLRNLFFRLVGLLRQNTLPVVVLDGIAPSLKSGVMELRQQKHTGKPVIQKNGKPNLSRTRFSKVSQECIELLNAFGVPWVQSPGEAEAMCALLNSSKLVDACITNDGDAFLYGAETVYRHFSMDSRDSSVRVFHAHRIQKLLNLTRSDLVLLSLLLGCDYWPSGVSRLGPAGALRLITSLKSEIPSIDEEFFLKFLSWLINSPLKSCEDFSCNPFGLYMNPNVIKMWLRVGLELKNCPFKEIFAEFLTSFEKRHWTLPKRESVSHWKRPDPRRVVPFCQMHLNWDPVYTLQHFLPIMALWDLRHPEIYNAPSPIKSLIDNQIDDSLILKPLRIVKKRVVNYVESLEVEWKRLEFDKWTGQDNESNSNNANRQNKNIGENYYFSVPQIEFCKVHSDLFLCFKSKLNKTDKVQIPIDEALKGLCISTGQKNQSDSNVFKKSKVLTSLTNVNPPPLWESDSSSIDESECIASKSHKHLLSSAVDPEVNIGYKSDSEVLQNQTDCASSRPSSFSSSPFPSSLCKFKSAFPSLSRRSSSLSHLVNHCMLLKTSLLSESMIFEGKTPHSKVRSSSSSIFSSSSSYNDNTDDDDPCDVSWVVNKFRTPKTLKQRLSISNKF